MSRTRIAATAATAGLILGVASNAWAQGAGAAVPGDPWERFNRFSYGVFMALDRAVMAPVAHAYMRIVPRPVQKAIHNMLVNLSEPVVGMNDIFQGHIGKAALTSVRFATNTTFGLGGMIDVADPAGIPHHDNGFDLTLGHYHVGAGPYLFVPIIGPSSLRNLFGAVFDGAMDPFHWSNYPYRTALSISHASVGAIDARARGDAGFTALMSDATDPYATLRSVYLQDEAGQVDQSDGKTQPPLPDMEDDGAPKPDAAKPQDATPDATANPAPPAPPTAAEPSAPPTATPAPAAPPALEPAPKADTPTADPAKPEAPLNP